MGSKPRLLLSESAHFECMAGDVDDEGEKLVNGMSNTHARHTGKRKLNYATECFSGLKGVWQLSSHFVACYSRHLVK